MTKQYRHKKTNIIVTLGATGRFYYNLNCGVTTIPVEVVENSTEWQSLTPLFKSDDGFDVMEGDSWYYVVIDNKPRMNITSNMHYGGLPENMKPVKRFAVRKNAEDFLRTIQTSVSIAFLEINAKKLKISKTTLDLIKKHVVK